MPRTIDVIIQREAPHQRFIDALRDIIGMYPSQYEIRRRLKIIEIMNSYPPPKPWPPPPPPPPQYMDPGFVINGKAIQMAENNLKEELITKAIIEELQRQVKVCHENFHLIEANKLFVPYKNDPLDSYEINGRVNIIELAAAIAKAI